MDRSLITFHTSTTPKPSYIHSITIILAIINAMIGSNITSLPVNIYRTGETFWYFCIFPMLISCVLSYYSCYLYL